MEVLYLRKGLVCEPEHTRRRLLPLTCSSVLFHIHQIQEFAPPLIHSLSLRLSFSSAFPSVYPLLSSALLLSRLCLRLSFSSARSSVYPLLCSLLLFRSVLRVQYYITMRRLLSAIAVSLAATAASATPPLPLKVIILAGQSNMVGHGYAEGSELHWNASSTNQCGGTAGGCVDPHPELPPNLNGSLLTPEYAFLRSTSGDKWATHPGVWMVYNESADDSGLPAFPTPGPSGGYWHGDLSVGYGGDHKGLNIGGRTNRTEVGPELGLGWALGDAYKKQAGPHQQVLIIKTAWGGKTIDIDFRPPSSAKANASHPVGPYYKWMVREVQDALGKLDTFFPAYSGSNYEIAGFVWHQGDMDEEIGCGCVRNVLMLYGLQVKKTNS